MSFCRVGSGERLPGSERSTVRRCPARLRFCRLGEWVGGGDVRAVGVLGGCHGLGERIAEMDRSRTLELSSRNCHQPNET